MLVLVLAGSSALRFTLPLTLVITGMLALLVISYTQVISESIVIVPTSTVNLLTERAVTAAMSLGDTVVAVAVAGDEGGAQADPT